MQKEPHHAMAPGQSVQQCPIHACSLSAPAAIVKNEAAALQKQRPCSPCCAMVCKACLARCPFPSHWCRGRAIMQSWAAAHLDHTAERCRRAIHDALHHDLQRSQAGSQHRWLLQACVQEPRQGLAHTACLHQPRMHAASRLQRYITTASHLSRDGVWSQREAQGFFQAHQVLRKVEVVLGGVGKRRRHLSKLPASS